MEVDADILDNLMRAVTRIERTLNTRIKEKLWLTKAEAMAELGCKSSKICQLRAEGKILINGEAGPGKQVLYSLASIRKYQANPDRS